MGARLLILSPTDDRGGAEEYLLTVAKKTAIDRGWEATVSFELTPRTRSIVEELRTRCQASSIDARVGDGRRWAVIRQGYATARVLAERPS